MIMNITGTAIEIEDFFNYYSDLLGINFNNVVSKNTGQHLAQAGLEIVPTDSHIAEMYSATFSISLPKYSRFVRYTLSGATAEDLRTLSPLLLLDLSDEERNAILKFWSIKDKYLTLALNSNGIYSIADMLNAIKKFQNTQDLKSFVSLFDCELPYIPQGCSELLYAFNLIEPITSEGCISYDRVYASGFKHTHTSPIIYFDSKDELNKRRYRKDFYKFPDYLQLASPEFYPSEDFVTLPLGSIRNIAVGLGKQQLFSSKGIETLLDLIVIARAHDSYVVPLLTAFELHTSKEFDIEANKPLTRPFWFELLKQVIGTVTSITKESPLTKYLQMLDSLE